MTLITTETKGVTIASKTLVSGVWVSGLFLWMILPVLVFTYLFL